MACNCNKTHSNPTTGLFKTSDGQTFNNLTAARRHARINGLPKPTTTA